MRHQVRTVAAVCALALIGAACSGTETLQSGPAGESSDEVAAPTAFDELDAEDDQDDGAETDTSTGSTDTAARSDSEDGADGGSERTDTSGPEGGDEARSSEPDQQDQDSGDPDVDESSEDDEDPERDDEGAADVQNSEIQNSEIQSSDDENEGQDEGDGGESAASGLAVSGPADSGDHVLALQERLAELGFAPGNPDGSYGARTSQAIVAFQDLIGINETGLADARTVGALARYRYDGLLLRSGDEGGMVEALQQRLTDGPFDPGPVDGVYGTGTTQAVWALEKMAGIPVDGDWGPLDERAWQKLRSGAIGGPEKSHDQRWVEVDLSQQVMKVYDPGSNVPTLVSHASSGSGVPWENEEFSGSSVTPLGDFHINRRINGWRESSLNIGRLYNPLYFNGGIAFHGATSVPLHPASHGCVRLPMHVADYLPGELPNGTPVHILR